jgi:hypothetical protein
VAKECGIKLKSWLSPVPRAASSVSGPARALERGGPAGARGCRLRARARAPPRPEPLQGSGLLCYLPHPPHWSGRGVPKPPGPEGEGYEVSASEQAPPPRGRPRSPQGRRPTSRSNPAPSVGRGGRVARPLPLAICVRVGACGLVLQWTGVFCARGRSSTLSAGPLLTPPPGPGVGGTRSLLAKGSLRLDPGVEWTAVSPRPPSCLSPRIRNVLP